MIIEPFISVSNFPETLKRPTNSSITPLLLGVVKVVGHAQPFQVKVIEGEYHQVAGAVEGVGEGYHGVEVGKKDGMTKIEECGCGHESQQPHP